MRSVGRCHAMTSDFHRPVSDNLSGEYEVGEDSDQIESDQTPLLPAARDMAVKDRYKVAYLIFYLLGLGSLLPWNFFITASDYWMYKLRDINASEPAAIIVVPTFSPNASTISSLEKSTSSKLDDGVVSQSSLQSLFLNSLALCTMLPNMVFQFLNTLLRKRIPLNARILVTLGLIVLIFVFTEIMVKIDTSQWQYTFFTITLSTVVLLNCCSAVFQSSVFGLAAQFPQKYCGAVMAGQGMGGVFAALAMIISLAFSSTGPPTESALIFFSTAIAVLLLTMVCYVFLTKLKFYQFFVDVEHSGKVNQTDVPLGQTSGDEEAEDTKFLHPEGINSGNGWGQHDGDVIDFEHPSSTSGSSREEKIGNPEASLLSIAKEIRLYMFSAMYTFLVTLACFPAITAKIKSTAAKSTWSDTYFTPVCCFLLFNSGDWLGRTSASYIHIPSINSKVSLLICVLSRTVFLILFPLCNYQPRYHLPVIFQQDFYFIIFMVLFALSNGHLSTLSMQYGPKEVEPENAATAGTILAFMMSVGLLSGAGVSFLLCSFI